MPDLIKKFSSTAVAFLILILVAGYFFVFENGKPEREMMWVNNVPDGNIYRKFYKYYTNGQLKEVYAYENKKLIEFKTFDENGNLISEENSFLNSEELSIQYFIVGIPHLSIQDLLPAFNSIIEHTTSLTSRIMKIKGSLL